MSAVGVLELRLLKIVVHNTSGATKAEEQSVRALRDRDPVGIIGIKSDVGQEVSPSPVRIRKTTHPSLLGVTTLSASATIATIRTGRFRIGGVEKQIFR